MDTNDQLETTSRLHSDEAVVDHYARHDRQHRLLVSDCLTNALSKVVEGWHVTLNTKAVIEDKRHFDAEYELLDRQLRSLSSRLNKYCYRRRPNSRLKMLAGMEVGKMKRLHVHLVIGHPGDVHRSTAEIEREVTKNWQRVYRFDQTGFVQVKPIHDLDGIVRYITKDWDWMIARFDNGSVLTY